MTFNPMSLNIVWVKGATSALDKPVKTRPLTDEEALTLPPRMDRSLVGVIVEDEKIVIKSNLQL